MSEANTEGTQQTQPAQPAAVDQKVIEQIQKEAVAKATEAAKKMAEEAAVKARQEAKADIINSLTGGDKESRSEKLLNSLVGDPEAVLNTVVEAAKRQALEEFEEKDSKRREQDQLEKARTAELAQASRELLKTRPDIASSEAAKELLNTYYVTLPDNLSEAEKIKEAARKYDLFMEKVDGKSAEERIKAAQSITSSASAQKDAPVKKTLEESAQERVLRAEADWKKKFPNARIPRY